MVLEISIVIFLFMVILFIISLVMRDNTIAYSGWCFGFILISVVSMFQGGQIDLSKFIMNLFVWIWAVRLAYYMITRNRNRPEDFRYAHYRKSWKFFTLRSFFQIYMLQGFVMLIVSAPVWYSNFSYTSGFDFFDFPGAIVFLTGFYIEVKADSEMAEFRKNPHNKGKILTTGLWSLTRHPNYFGEALIWCGICLFSFNYPFGWLTIISPLFMTAILRYVTGVPLMEKRIENRQGYEEYVENTPVFFLSFEHFKKKAKN